MLSTLSAPVIGISFVNQLDSLNYAREYNVNAKRAFKRMANEHNLVDSWRETHPNQNTYTWRGQNPFQCGRLDMFFISSHLMNRASDIEILPGYRSDHSIITLTLQTKQQKRGPGIWMLNVSHLNDETFSERIKECIYDAVRQYAVPGYPASAYNEQTNYETIQLTINDCLFYETLIMLMRGESVKYSKQKARASRTTEKILFKELKLAQERFNRTSTQEDALQLVSA